MHNTFKTPLALAAATTFAFAAVPSDAEDISPVVLAQFQLDGAEASGQPLTDFFDRILSGTHSYEGNMSAVYFVSQDDPSKILLLEEWESKADFDSYLNWRIERGDFAELTSLLESDPVLTFYER
ncbi:putative quinol monooxygenase [Roseovarius sp. EL26]|uniref:putative quinol monooxygenase n=1 Tax=Roseovarius sp. EL26 TaxID=2126672 RepID=UPI0013C449DB|nr:antibiotic biosynthesis monooxygenase family protein [Roseovarius sp. EL26]